MIANFFTTSVGIKAVAEEDVTYIDTVSIAHIPSDKSRVLFKGRTYLVTHSVLDLDSCEYNIYLKPYAGQKK